MEKFLHFLFLTLLVGTLKATPLTTVAAVKSLSPEEAALQKTVEIEAQVLKIAYDIQGMFIHDGELGIYVSLEKIITENSGIQQGDFIKIKGTTNQGHFLPHIDAREIKMIRSRILPTPFRMTKKTFFEPGLDCAWVELEGTVIDSIPTGKIISLRLKCFGDQITNIVLPGNEETAEYSKELINHTITARVIAVTKSNSRRQMIQRFFHAHSMEDIIAQTSPNNPPLLGLNELLRIENPSAQVRVQGIVVHTEGRKLFLQDESGNGLLVITKNSRPWKMGQKIEALGRVEIDPFAPSLRSQKLTILSGNHPLTILPLALPNELLPAKWHHAFVSLEADLLDLRSVANRRILSCFEKGHYFEVTLTNQTAPISIATGSRLRLQGICTLRSNQPDSLYHQPDGISLLARSQTDIQILKAPPWWTLQKILIIAAIIGCVALTSLIWAGLLRRQVTSQTKVIGTQIEREVTQRERQRLARELHDSVEQGIGTIAMQLTTAERHRELGNLEKLKKSLELAQRMVSYSQRDYRESIYDLRREGAQSISSWRDELLLNEAENHGAELKTSTFGTPYRLGKGIGNHIVKIIREASVNALRHGKADTVMISYTYLEDRLDIEIKDNGCGFDTNKKPPRGHFGVIGMRERAQRLAAKFSINSSPAEGTTVYLSLLRSTEIS